MTEDTIIGALDKTTDHVSTISKSPGIPSIRLSMKFEENTLEKSASVGKKKNKIKGTLSVFQLSASNLPR